MSQQFEYDIRHINRWNSEMKVINEMAAKGYRLVAASPYCSGNSFYFERPKQEIKNTTNDAGNEG
jgi:hypothetical protein